MNAGSCLVPLIAERVDVIDVAARGRLRFLARARDHGLFRFALHSIRIGKNEMAFVFGAGLEIQKAAGKHVGCDIAVVMPAAFARQLRRGLVRAAGGEAEGPCAIAARPSCDR